MKSSSFKENFNTINKRVVHYRKLANLTQSETAEKMDMKLSTYSQMERVGKISGERIVRLSEIFNIDQYLLLHNEFDEENTATKQGVEDAVLRQETVDVKQPAAFIPTAKEIGFIKMFRNIPRADQQEVIAFLSEKHNQKHKK